MNRKSRRLLALYSYYFYLNLSAERQSLSLIHIFHAADALVERGGATEVYACASHGVLSGPAIERIQNSPIKELTILDTIPLTNDKKLDKINVRPVAPVFTEAIARIYEETSVSTLFD